jgi:hypothetical protein
MNVKIEKQVFLKGGFDSTIDKNFNQLKSPNIEPTIDISSSVDDFFISYGVLFYDIPKEGEINSHRFLIDESSKYLGSINTNVDDALLEEIFILRTDNLNLREANVNLEIENSNLITQNNILSSSITNESPESSQEIIRLTLQIKELEEQNVILNNRINLLNNIIFDLRNQISSSIIDPSNPGAISIIGGNIQGKILQINYSTIDGDSPIKNIYVRYSLDNGNTFTEVIKSPSNLNYITIQIDSSNSFTEVYAIIKRVNNDNTETQYTSPPTQINII